jgi:hypothetical protein
MLSPYAVMLESQAVPHLIEQLGRQRGVGSHDKIRKCPKISRIVMYNYCYTPFITEYTPAKVFTVR